MLCVPLDFNKNFTFIPRGQIVAQNVLYIYTHTYLHSYM